jgi:hypothetical protein
MKRPGLSEMEWSAFPRTCYIHRYGWVSLKQAELDAARCETKNLCPTHPMSTGALWGTEHGGKILSRLQGRIGEKALMQIQRGDEEPKSDREHGSDQE